MTDWPEAVRTYEEMKAELDPGHWNALAAYADAAIEALKDKNEWLENCWRDSLADAEKAEMNYDTAKSGWLGEVQRREQAEAKLKTAEGMMSLQLKQIQQAEAEVERLKVMLQTDSDRGDYWKAEVERLKWMLRDVLENYVIPEYGGDIEVRIAEASASYDRRRKP